jgi:hypothetical protein
MDLSRFREIVEAYGADPVRWPPAERAAAEVLLSRSSEAVALRDEAAQLDAALSRLGIAAVSPGLAERVLNTAPAEPPPARSWLSDWLAELWPGEPAWRPAMALAASMIIGLAVGAFAPLMPPEDPVDVIGSDDIAGFLLDEEDAVPGWDG